MPGGKCVNHRHVAVALLASEANLTRELNGKLRIAVYGIMCHTLITQRVHGRFYGLN